MPLDPIEDPTLDVDNPNPDDSGTPPGNDPDKGKDPIQQIKSWVGRVEAQGKEDRGTMKEIMKTLQAIRENTAAQAPRSNDVPMNPDLKVLNDELQNEILTGNVVQALDRYVSLREQATTRISEANREKAERAIGALEGQPFFDQVRDHVRKTAMENIGQGMPPEVAVQLAWHKNRADFASGLIATISEKNPNLNLLKGGKGMGDDGSGGKGDKLPDHLERAFERDKKAGVFKDRKEYIASMSPQLKADLRKQGYKV